MTGQEFDDDLWSRNRCPEAAARAALREWKAGLVAIGQSVQAIVTGFGAMMQVADEEFRRAFGAIR